MSKNRKPYTIKGSVTGLETGKGLQGLTVSVWDKDLMTSDEHLDTTKTDAKGNFSISFSASDALETYPDPYVMVQNKKGELIYCSETHWNVSEYLVMEIEIPEVWLEKMDEEYLRKNHKAWLAKNPNFFGKVPDLEIVDPLSGIEFPVILPKKNNTDYEELTCIGLYPERDELEAVIRIKRPNGYKGGLCEEGSFEYVAFFIDYGDGDGFVPAGPMAKVNVHDLDYLGNHKEDVYYAVRTVFEPEFIKYCSEPQVVKLRAILSWDVPPNGRDFPPVYGNTLEEWVQIRPKNSFSIFSPDTASPGIPLIAGTETELLQLAAGSLEAKELESAKNPNKLETARKDFAELIAKNPNYFGAISKAKTKEEFMLDTLQWDPQLHPFDDLQSWEQYQPQADLSGNTSYEELKCVGFYPEQDMLEAIVEIKRPYGYKGNLCTFGSPEFVAFYVNWGGGWSYEGTGSFRAHDQIASNKRSIMYAVRTQILDIQNKLKLCKDENIVRVRAILSWDQAPNWERFNPTWGNVMERMIQIRPKKGDNARCSIDVISDQSIQHVSQGGADRGLAVKLNANGLMVPGSYDRPFGGIVTLHGNVDVPGAIDYRVSYRHENDFGWTIIRDRRYTLNAFGGWLNRQPDAEGWFTINSYRIDQGNYPLTPLIQWNSGNREGLYFLKLELKDAEGNVLPNVCEVAVMLDNRGPVFYDFQNAQIPASGVTIKTGNGQLRNCGQFEGPTDIKVYGNFFDEYFGSYSIKLFGGDIAAQGIVLKSDRYDSPDPVITTNGIANASNPGSGHALHTINNMCDLASVACAYGVKLNVSDRTIVGWISNRHVFRITSRHREAFATFNWDPNGCP